MMRTRTDPEVVRVDNVTLRSDNLSVLYHKMSLRVDKISLRSDNLSVLCHMMTPRIDKLSARTTYTGTSNHVDEP